MGGGKKTQQGADVLSFSFPPVFFSLCWIVPFDLQCSERRALCNISSTHMAVCVTAKHMGGGGGGAVLATAGRCGSGRREREQSGCRGGSVDVRRRTAALHVGVGSFSLLRLLSGAAVTWAP